MSRIFIDCTYVFEHPQDNSGIQRVVRNVVAELPGLRAEFDARAVIFDKDGLMEVSALLPSRREYVLGRMRTFADRAAGSGGRFGERFADYFALRPGARVRLRGISAGVVWLATSVTKLAWLIGPADLTRSRLRRLRPRPGDQLVLLDSSWHYDLSVLERVQQAGVEIVPVIHDLIPLTHPQFCVEDLVRVFETWFARTSRLASGFLSISRATEDILKARIRRMRGPAEIERLWFDHYHHGARLDLADHGEPDPDLRAAFAGKDPVYLAVGTVEPRKNHGYALAAFEHLWSQGARAKLCLIGKSGWKSERLIERILTHPRFGTDLFWFDSANDASLAYAYRHARALIYPSHFEGFGLPMIEAMQYGLPVMASDIPIFREVGGGYVAYFDRTEPQELAALVQRFEAEGVFPAPQSIAGWRWHGWREATRDILETVRRYRGFAGRVEASEPPATGAPASPTEASEPAMVGAPASPTEASEPAMVSASPLPAAAPAPPAPAPRRRRATRFERKVVRADRLRNSGRWSAAAMGYKRALRVEPQHGIFWVQLGHCLKESGQLLEAVAAYRRAAELDPNSSDAALHLGSTLHMIGQDREAATHLLRALELDPAGARCGAALGALGPLHLPRERLVETLGEPPARPGHIYLDLMDAVEYFDSGRRPTGIQRVQLELAQACLDEGEVGPHRFCFFARKRAAFVELPWGLVRDLCEAARQQGDAASAIRHAQGKLRFYGDNAPVLRFPEGASLVSLGPAWTAPSFFDAVRRAKAQAELSYGVLMHDVIPLKMPRQCDQGTVGSYHTWLVEALEACDFFLANSESTKRDLIEAAGFVRLPLTPSRVTVMRLDADSISAPHEDPDAVLARLGIEEDFVLMVGTLEPRKNHAAAFEAWDIMTKSGRAEPPLLVCAGKWGWKTDGILEKLNKVEGRVMMISDLSDTELGVLYRRALFTLFPSLYEGWGLPVTESLCHGTPVLAAGNSSLPEAGGDLAVYFDAADPADLAARAMELFSDRPRLDRLRRRIGAEFQARSWQELLSDVDRAVRSVNPRARIADEDELAAVPS